MAVLSNPSERPADSGTGRGSDGAYRSPRFGALRRLYMTLRMEHTSPLRVGFAVAVGVFVGCSPFWGAHLALCVLAATAFRLNRVLVYAAANLANPITAVPLIALEVHVGRRLLGGDAGGVAWPSSFDEAIATGRSLFLAWLLGSAVVGVALGLGFGALAWWASRSGRHTDSFHDLVDRVALRYLDISIRDAEAARSALLRNPVWPMLVDDPSFSKASRVVDLGCGRALAAALGVESEARVPAGRTYLGVDSSDRYIRVARRALEGLPGHVLVSGDLRDFDPPAADLVLAFNVLHYLPVPAQDALLRRLGRSLPPGARLFVRDIDAGKTWSARLALARDAVVLLVPGRARYGLHPRRATDLRNALVAAGFDVIDRTTPRAASRARFVFEAVRRPAAVPRIGIP